MNSLDTKNAMECVEVLNTLYYEQTKDEERLPFSFVYTNFWKGIKYFDETVWDDCDYDTDTKDILDKEDNYIGQEVESIYDCVKRRVLEIHKITRKFKLYEN